MTNLPMIREALADDTIASYPDFTKAVGGALDELESLQRTLEFVQSWAWRTDPPNASHKLSDEERLSAIKYHPAIRTYQNPSPVPRETTP